MPSSTYTYNEPWTAGVDRLANTVYQIMEAKRQKAMQDQMLFERQRKIELEDKAMKERDKFLKSARETLAPQQVTTPDPSKVPGMGVGMLRPEFQTQTQQIELSPQDKVNRLMQLAMQSQDPFGAIKEIAPMANMIMQSQKGPAGKQFSANNLYDLFAVQSAQQHGGDVTTPEGYNQFLHWAGTPEGVAAWKGFMQNQAKGETFKEQYIGPSATNPGYDVWTVYDAWGKGHTELRPSAGIALPRNIGRTPASAISQGVQFDTIRGNIARIRKNLNEDWVGPVAGRAYRAQEALTGLADDNQSMFYADVNDLADMLLRARSGAQINEQEYQRLAKLVPTPNLPPKVFKERLNRFETQLLQTLKAQQERLKKGGYLAPSKSTVGPEVQSESGGEMRVGDFIIREKK